MGAGAFAALGMDDCLLLVARAFSAESRFKVAGVVAVAVIGGKAEGGCFLEGGRVSTAAASKW
jgi:hypothetical protein